MTSYAMPREGWHPATRARLLCLGYGEGDPHDDPPRQVRGMRPDDHHEADRPVSRGGARGEEVDLPAQSRGVLSRNHGRDLMRTPAQWLRRMKRRKPGVYAYRTDRNLRPGREWGYV